jgi:hypothetical protein
MRMKGHRFNYCSKIVDAHHALHVPNEGNVEIEAVHFEVNILLHQTLGYIVCAFSFVCFFSSYIDNTFTNGIDGTTKQQQMKEDNERIVESEYL